MNNEKIEKQEKRERIKQIKKELLKLKKMGLINLQEYKYTLAYNIQNIFDN